MSKEMPHVLDRNGRAIKLGDRVRIVDERDDVLWELDVCREGVPEKCLEVVDA